MSEHEGVGAVDPKACCRQAGVWGERVVELVLSVFGQKSMRCFVPQHDGYVCSVVSRALALALAPHSLLLTPCSLLSALWNVVE